MPGKSSVFQRVLCCVDGSDNAERAAAQAGQVAKQSGGTVILLSVYHIPNEMQRLEVQMGAGVSFVERVRRRFSEKHRQTLESISQSLAAQGLRVEQILREGPPGPAIVKCAQEAECDSVVIGSRGMGDFKRLLLGSVSDYVVHHSNLPCLVVP